MFERIYKYIAELRRILRKINLTNHLSSASSFRKIYLPFLYRNYIRNAKWIKQTRLTRYDTNARAG